jgi:hypothetical protein
MKSPAPNPFLLRVFDPEADYETVASWWRAHEWNPVPVQVLPKLGIVAERDGVSIAAGWLYMDNSVGVGWLEWLVASPEATPRQVFQSISAVIGFIKSRAAQLGYHTLMTTCRQQSLGRLLERNGFQKTDASVSHYIGRII